MLSKRYLMHLNRMEVNKYLKQFSNMKHGGRVTENVPERFNANDEVLSFVAQKFDEMSKMFQEENASLRARLDNIVEELAEQKAAIDRLLNQDKEVAELPIKVNFPIDAEEDLVALNEAINNSNRDAYIKTMSIILKPHGVLRSMRYILTDRFMMEFNLDGVHGKKSLKSYANFYGALLKAIPVTSKSGPAELQLRDAIKMQKNRVFQIALQRRKRQRESEMNE